MESFFKFVISMIQLYISNKKEDDKNKREEKQKLELEFRNWQNSLLLHVKEIKTLILQLDKTNREYRKDLNKVIDLVSKLDRLKIDFVEKGFKDINYDLDLGYAAEDQNYSWSSLSQREDNDKKKLDKLEDESSNYNKEGLIINLIKEVEKNLKSYIKLCDEYYSDSYLDANSYMKFICRYIYKLIDGITLYVSIEHRNKELYM